MEENNQKSKLMFSKLRTDMLKKNESLEENINEILRMLSTNNINRYLRISSGLPPEQKKQFLKSMRKFTNARKSYDENLENAKSFKTNRWRLCDYDDLRKIDEEMDFLAKDTKRDIENIKSVYNTIADAIPITEFADDDFKDDDKKDWRQIMLDEIEKQKMREERQKMIDEIVKK
jgi:hypothetical protein